MSDEHDDDELVTAAEAAERLGLHAWTVRRWANRKLLSLTSHTMIRGKYTALYRWADVMACAEQREANRRRYQTKATG